MATTQRAMFTAACVALMLVLAGCSERGMPASAAAPLQLPRLTLTSPILADGMVRDVSEWAGVATDPAKDACPELGRLSLQPVAVLYSRNDPIPDTLLREELEKMARLRGVGALAGASWSGETLVLPCAEPIHCVRLSSHGMGLRRAVENHADVSGLAELDQAADAWFALGEVFLRTPAIDADGQRASLLCWFSASITGATLKQVLAQKSGDVEGAKRWELLMDEIGKIYTRLRSQVIQRHYGPKPTGE